MNKEVRLTCKEKLIIRQCHMCGKVTESKQEKNKCNCCGKAFLPLNYFAKIHDHSEVKFNELFAESQDLNEEDMITGIYVLW